ncbi:hypothetical protein ACEWY4_002777 [Coilia grayii]|uniref:Uncharacterized protein n=1 Tax=Coilia grayii TaxID=363190 RepID=A0ABD1KPU3_9TELE
MALAAVAAESNQNAAAIMHIQGILFPQIVLSHTHKLCNWLLKNVNITAAQLCHLAKHLAGQRLEERFEALHCEVSSELHYLRTLLLPSSSPGPSSSLCLPSMSKPHSIHPQNQPGLSHIAQELYHSRRILWEQIGALREEVHDIQHQLSKEDMQRRLTERFSKDQVRDAVMLAFVYEICLVLYRADISQLQKSLKKITISKGKAPKKSGRVFKPLTKSSLISDSDDSSTQLGMTARKAIKEISPTAR